MKDKILVLDRGFIGQRIQEELGCEISDRKIYNFADADSEISKFNPAVIINTIGHIGRNVDDCEKDIDKTLISNSFAPLILAEAALRRNLRFVHISSGCIYHYDYDKDSPLSEKDIPDFFELFYSRSKIYSDLALESLCRKYDFLIIRIRVPLDNRPHPRNLLDKLIAYKKVIDLPNSVTYIPDFIKALSHLLAIKARGTFNVVNKTALEYAELMDVYCKYVPDFKYEIVEFKKLNLVRTNLIMSADKLERSGFKVRDIHDVLEECVQGYLKSK